MGEAQQTGLMRGKQGELTLRALVLGGILAVLLGAANAYLGLFAGMTVSACIPSAVISMGVLRLLGNASIGENTMVMTQASAGEALAAAAIFTLPALVLLGIWDDFPYLWVTAIVAIGGLLGVLLTIPLRRALIIEQQLKFPEGTAVAEVLRVGEKAGQGLRLLVGAGVLGALTKFAETGLLLWTGTAQAASFVGRGIAYFGTNLSPALLGIGYIVGLNIAALVFIGSLISWGIAIPVYAVWFLPGDPLLADSAGTLGAADLAFLIWTEKIRYLGVGAMLVGGLWALVAIRHSLFSGVKSGLEQFRQSASRPPDPRERDLPMPWVLAGIVACVLPIHVLYHQIVGHHGIAAAMAVTMLVAGFLFSSVAAYMAGLVGSSNNPVSGVTMATMLMASLLLVMLLGAESESGPAAAIMIGAVVCCAAAMGGDLLQDLKTGQLLGASPWKQQLALAAGVLVSVFVMAPVLNLLLKAYGIGIPTPEHPKPLVAPQATLMASVVEGVFHGGLPWGLVGAGAAIGVAIILVDEWLRHRQASFRAPVLAVAVGIYLPLEVDVPIFLGGLIAHAVQRRLRQSDSGAGNGTLFAAGLITGEALIGILLAIPIVVTGSTEMMAVPEAFRPGATAGLAALGLAASLLWRAASHSPD